MGIQLPGARVRKRLVAIFFLILVPSFLTSLDLEILPDILVTGRVITLKITTGIPDTEDISVGDIKLPDDLALISGPIVRPYYARVEGRNKRFHQVTWALKSKNSGIFFIPDIEVLINGVASIVKVPTITVLDNDEKFNKYPLIVEWNKNIDKEIYVGESLPLVVEAYNLEEINFPDKVISTSPRKGEILEVSGLGDINPERVGSADLYRVPMASWIYTPFEAGLVTIPSVRVDINGLTRYTESLKINVLPLRDINATGGVGEFLISTEIDQTQVTPDDLFHYKVKISGQGNIPYIKFPDIEYTGLILIDKSENKNIEPSEKGFLGWKELDYTFQAIDSGVKEISLSEVSWIDTNGEEIFYNGKISHINVVSVKVVEEYILPFLVLMKTPEIIDSYTISYYKNPYMWLFLSLSLVIVLIISLLKTIKYTKEKKTLLISAILLPLFLSSSFFAKGLEFQGRLVQADNYIENGEYQSALNIYSELSEFLPYNYGVFVNKAILWDKLGNISQSVYNIRIAERIVPNNKKISLIKSYLSESEESSQKQAKTSNPINPNYIFILLVVFFNLMVFSCIRLCKVRNITHFSLFFTTLLFAILCTIFLIFVDQKNSVEAGVISTNGAKLTKVPNIKALEWMTLKEGNCVYIIGEWEDQFLIETEYGLQGWVYKESLLVLEDR